MKTYLEKEGIKDEGTIERVLDVGTGTGILALLANREFPNADVVVTDLNPDAVKNAFINWILNGGDPKKFVGIVGDGLSEEVVQQIESSGELPDLVVANLPQQPLCDIEGLEGLRNQNPAFWNVDPSRDPDGLGIFISVLSQIPKITKPGARIFVTAASKQNFERVSKFLNELVENGNITKWEIIGKRKFRIPDTYDRRLITHWLEREGMDRVERIWQGKDGHWYYTHYNIVVIR